MRSAGPSPCAIASTGAEVTIATAARVQEAVWHDGISECWSLTITRWCAKAFAMCSMPSPASRWSPKRRTGARRSSWRCSIVPTWSCWTSRCRKRPGSRRPRVCATCCRQRACCCSACTIRRSMYGKACASARSGYILKDSAGEELRAAIRAVHAGGTFFSPAVVQAADVGRTVEAPSAAALLAALTPRERDVLDGVARGLTNKAIAADLGHQSSHRRGASREPHAKARDPQRCRPHALCAGSRTGRRIMMRRTIARWWCRVVVPDVGGRAHERAPLPAHAHERTPSRRRDRPRRPIPVRPRRRCAALRSRAHAAWAGSALRDSPRSP